jgi:tyrosine-protein kinase Etk/Wzc
MIGSNLNLDNSIGLTDYLTGELYSLSEIYHEIDRLPGLHVYLAGQAPWNSADILLTDKMNQLFKDLKSKYDYVIVDSPPAALVSDPFILGEYSDIILYIIRCKKTLKKQIDFINEIVKDKTLNNVSLVLNDVNLINGYGYGNGSKSDYNYGQLNGVKKKKPFSTVLK